MGKLEKSQTCHLEEAFAFLVDYYVHIARGQAVCREELAQVFFSKSLEWTAMVLASTWCLLVDDLRAVPGLIVVSLTLLTKHVPYIVCIVLLKFV